MHIDKLLHSKPPEYYNQSQWLSMNQRHAWLLQRWLNCADNEPLHYFYGKDSALFIGDESLEMLFNDSLRYVVRYVEDCYWLIWNQAPYYFVLCEEFKDVWLDSYSFPHNYNREMLKEFRVNIENTLIKIRETGDLPLKLAKQARQENYVGTSGAVWANMPDTTSIEFRKPKIKWTLNAENFSFK